MDTYLGFGIVMDDNTALNDSCYENLLYTVQDSSSFIYEKYLDFCRDEDVDDEDVENLKEFCKTYENENDATMGLPALLADLINEIEYNDQYVIFHYVDCVLHVAANIPYDEEERNTFPTQKEIQELLEKYLEPLLNELPIPDWQMIHD